MLRSPLRASRWLTTFLVLCLIASAIVYQPQARAATDLVLGADAEVADAQGDNVNLRDAPSYTGNVLTSVPEGWLVNVLDGPFTDDLDGTMWYQVVARGQTGYMLSDYLVNADGDVFPAAAAVTTANVNLRSGPGTSFGVLLVIPNGSTVNTTGSVQNGFTQLTYNGTTGWSASQYISVTGGTTSGIVADGPLNLRSGPGTSFSVLAVMPTGANLTITGALTNGFYPVRYNGTAGYAAAAFIQVGSNPTPTPTTPSGQTATVIDGALNLRSGPGLTYAVILVMPGGSTVTITGALQNGYYPVRYGSTNGFASATYLQIGTGPSPTPTRTATPVSRTAWTTAGLNLRTGASTSTSVILVIPNGAQITVTGNLTNGFYPVRYGSTNGFASATYITFTSPGPTPTATVPVGGTIVWPVTGGTWEVIQGYNGSSHQNNSSTWQYLYSLDIARTDGQTAGISAFAPVSGTVAWYERSSGGITINMGNGYAVAMFHLTVDRGWEPGDTVQQGDFIGTISAAGGEGFVQVPHIHITLWQTNDGGNWNRVATPFTGQFAISGSSFPSNGSAFQWSGFEFTP
jgi:uncharacterized protein YraI